MWKTNLWLSGDKGEGKLGDCDWHIHATLYKIDNSKNLLYSTGNSTQYSVTNCTGKESKK